VQTRRAAYAIVVRLIINTNQEETMKKRRIIITISTLVIIFLLALLTLPKVLNERSVQDWPSEIERIEYFSSADNTLQPALFYKPDIQHSSPLLVALHTWSGDYLQNSSIPYAEWCIENNWIFIHPNFRGPNNNPTATGSKLVIQDIVSAVEYAKNNSNVDPKRIYLVGASGGGYTALLVSALHPDIWTAVSVWVPITDLTAWYYESEQLKTKYADDIMQSLGGTPDDSSKIATAYKSRSPLTYLNNELSLPIDINVGINDGHSDNSVPISHSLLAFNALAELDDRLSENEISYLVKQASIPQHLISPLSDPTYGQKELLFRRNSRNVRITIFEGGHEIIFNAALNWLAYHEK